VLSVVNQMTGWKNDIPKFLWGITIKKNGTKLFPPSDVVVLNNSILSWSMGT